MKRTKVFNDFKEFKQGKDTKTMDEICKNTGDFKLQVQQNFLKEYITKNPDWKQLLLFHGLGSGKTCTAITMAEQYMALNPSGRVTVVLPARLRTNFFDELISPCGMEKYISQEDVKAYHSSNSSTSKKARIRTAFLKKIAEKYEVLSFEKFKNLAFKAASITDWISKFTKDRLLIFDEVHNLISEQYDEKKYSQTIREDKLQRAKGSSTMLFKYLCHTADTSCKMIFLTATPVFNSIAQFKQLVEIMNKDYHIPKDAKLADVIEKLRGKVSYFPGTSPNAYPTTSYVIHEIPLSKKQDEIMAKIQENELDEESEKESFKIKQRMAGIACYHNNINKNLDNIAENAPKIKTLIEQITKHKGKHIVYSTFIKNGLHIVKEALRRKGWISIQEAMKSKDATERAQYSIYALWDGSVKDNEKQMIKSIANNKDNLDGKNLRVILGSPSIREGVSFKHVQHLHMMDPVWNSSAKAQIEGRAIRFCSHVDVPKDHPVLKRHVEVNIYKSVPRKSRDALVHQTCDQEIYEVIIPEKANLVRAAENALKKVAIDYYLFRKMYRSTPSLPSVPDRNMFNTVDSKISVADDVDLKKKQKKIVKFKTCPKRRRPEEKDPGRFICPSDHYLKENLHGDLCCYKITKKMLQEREQQGNPKNVSSKSKKVVRKKS